LTVVRSQARSSSGVPAGLLRSARSAARWKASSASSSVADQRRAVASISAPYSSISRSVSLRPMPLALRRRRPVGA